MTNIRIDSLREIRRKRDDAIDKQISAIITWMARRLGCSQAKFLGPIRVQPLVSYRQLAMWIASAEVGASLPVIGAAFGGRDHTTVLHAVRSMDERLKSDDILRKIVGEFRAEIKKEKAA